MKTRAKTTFWNRLWIAAQEVERPNQIHTCSTGNRTNKLNSWNFDWEQKCKSVGRKLLKYQVVGLFQTVVTSNRQVFDVVISLHLPELWPLGSFLFCPCITSLKFLSCSPCTVPPFELYSGGAVVPIIASVMSWSLILSLRDQSDRHFMAIFGHFCLFSLLS